METKYIKFDYDKSSERMDKIIQESDNSFEELNEIPSRSALTFTNGYYVNCSALFVDIRGSSELPNKHTRPKLAKLYRVYISEIVALINSYIECSEVNIAGDCVWGVFNTPNKSDINSVFSCAYSIASLINIMNYKFNKKGIEKITIGIGMAYGRALMIKAGYSGSTINDIVWMGDVVNEASKLCSYGNKTWSERQIMVQYDFYSNLNEHNQKLLEWNSSHSCYHGNVINTTMENWYNENCK